MKKPPFSVALPSCTEGLCYPVPFSNLSVIKQVATHAEALGYHSVWPNDHLSTQKYVRERWPTPPNYYDPFICLAFAADVTTNLRLGTGVTVLVAVMLRGVVAVLFLRRPTPMATADWQAAEAAV